jgi:hypothetical protein
MAQEATESEPTMEEILASIRRIIDEDDQPAEEAAAEEAPAAEAQPEPEAPAEDDVLELTDRVEEPAGGTEPLAVEDDLMIVDRDEDEVVEAPEPEPVAEAPMPEPEPEPEPEPVAAAPEPAPAPEPIVDEDALLDQTAASAAAGAFSALNENLRIGSGEGTTLETIVRELMRPMLKQWLDTNLPRIVEEKVEAEIARVSRRR